ncbi:MAG: electron transport complex subunit RsxG [Gammaproteobacteria bacterium]|nr:MAG: electron transport complex subunit RsxG [Gammaproteobacteria bacterium]
MIITAVILLLFAITGTALVAFTYENTRDRIAANERETLLRKLHALIEPARHDNNLFEDTISVRNQALFGTADPVAIYRARMGSRPVALVLPTVAPDGYNGKIKLLVGINYEGTLAGVRVIAHKETPGLGDGIEIERSDWIYGFDDKSLDNPATSRWQVKKDGGHFDQLTGATITPRAVVGAVRESLIYYRELRDSLFGTPENQDNRQ